MKEDHNHQPTRCTATCADGSPCQAWAVRGTEPPRCVAQPGCAAHGGGRAPVGAPRGNRNARTHGFYAHPQVPAEDWTLDTLIADVAARHASLSRYIERRLASDRVDHRELVRLLSLYQTSASRLGRLFQDRRTQEEVTERLRDLVAVALDQESEDPGAGG